MLYRDDAELYAIRDAKYLLVGNFLIRHKPNSPRIEYIDIDKNSGIETLEYDHKWLYFSFEEDLRSVEDKSIDVARVSNAILQSAINAQGDKRKNVIQVNLADSVHFFDITLLKEFKAIEQTEHLKKVTVDDFFDYGMEPSQTCQILTNELQTVLIDSQDAHNIETQLKFYLPFSEWDLCLLEKFARKVANKDPI